MTGNRRRLICIALALSMVLALIPGLPASAPARADSKTYGITTDKVNVRCGAGTKEKIMFSLPADHVCEIKESKMLQGVRWYKVDTTDPERMNGVLYTGYIHGDYLRELTDAEAATYASGGTVTGSGSSSGSSDSSGSSGSSGSGSSGSRSRDLPAIEGSIGVVTAGGTNFREGPGTGYRSIERLDRNTQVELLTIPSVRGAGAGTFYKVKYNGVTGYIMSDFISIVSGGPQTDGSSDPTTPPSGNATPTPPADSTPTPPPSGDATPTPAPTSSGGSSSGSFTHVKLILSSCHLRTSPGGDYDSDNDWVGQGSVLPLAGSSTKQGGYTWYPVTKNNKKYYVRGDCVQPFSDGSSSGGGSSPTASPSPTPEPTASGTILGYVKTIVGGCNLRATIGGTVIKQINKNVTLPYLLEPVEKNGYKWYFVQADGNRGYLRGDVVKVVSGGGGTVTATPSVTAEPETTATGYVKTIASGINLRKSAGYTDVIGRTNRDLVLPYYGSPTSVKGVKWYYVKHPTLGYGYLHENYVTLCNSDGSSIATPTPSASPTTTTTGSSGSSGQEASYTTLKLGSTGTAVKNLITELKNQGYYSGSIGTRYTTAVESAVKDFQRANGLTVDGIAGPATQHKLYGTVPIGAGDSSNLSMTLYPAEKIDWYTGGINELWARGSNYKVYDVKTGIVWWAHRWAGGLHVDAEPLTAADTARLCKCYGVSTAQEIKDKNLYQRRPLLVTIGTRTFACSLYGVPHNYPDGDTISTNEFKGQVCIHFTNSKTHDSQKVDSLHTEAIEYAWEHAPNGHK